MSHHTRIYEFYSDRFRHSLQKQQLFEAELLKSKDRARIIQWNVNRFVV